MSPTTSSVIILAILCLIVLSLGFGLFYLLRDPQGSRRTFISLTVRIALAMLLFLGIVVAVYFGWIVPNPTPI